MRKKIAVAGASGFIGSSLLPALSEHFDVIALTRGTPSSSPLYASDDLKNSVEWRRCDLFSLLQIEQALEGVDLAIYLVHSMLPSAQLSQGKFQDFDLLVADNFARAARMHGIEHVLYVGGIIPTGQKLSSHLKSRQEVEQALASYGTPVTALRCAIVIGKHGSSTQILLRIVKRLPFIFCPPWTNVKSSPVHISDLIAVLLNRLRGVPPSEYRSYDVAGSSVLSYREMIEITAEELGLKRFYLPLPFLPYRISSFLASFFTGAPRSLLTPLLESLRHPMLADGELNSSLAASRLSFREAMQLELAEKKDQRPPRAFILPEDEKQMQSVRSVQRLSLPKGYRGGDFGPLYARWLEKSLSPFLRVEVKGDQLIFRFPVLRKPLLILEISKERSSKERSLLYIVGGLLCDSPQRGRLEFREASDGKYLLVAIHDYRPSLPWFVYVLTQAKVHLLVMYLFGRYLEELSESQDA